MRDKELEKNFFNIEMVANEWIDGVEKKSSQREFDIYPKVSQWIEDCNPNTVLDLGCGQGICSQKINLKNRNYFGLDSSLQLITRANNIYRDSNKNFHLGDVYKVPFSEKFFDASFSILLWHMIEDLESAASELSRTLTINGNFLIITANPEAYSLWKEPYHYSTQEGICFKGKVKLKDKFEVEETLYLHSFIDLKESLERNDLHITHTSRMRPSSTKDGLKYFLVLEGIKGRGKAII